MYYVFVYKLGKLEFATFNDNGFKTQKEAEEAISKFAEEKDGFLPKQWLTVLKMFEID